MPVEEQAPQGQGRVVVSATKVLPSPAEEAWGQGVSDYKALSTSEVQNTEADSMSDSEDALADIVYQVNQAAVAGKSRMKHVDSMELIPQMLDAEGFNLGGIDGFEAQKAQDLAAKGLLSHRLEPSVGAEQAQQKVKFADHKCINRLNMCSLPHVDSVELLSKLVDQDDEDESRRARQRARAEAKAPKPKSSGFADPDFDYAKVSAFGGLGGGFGNVRID
mmetsp:Transcript_5186/g.8320  ORF Transcript_5186/g.8320 Transcript_5186/m.8320 type:complete len:220 (-) Transcript_5186:59-718(-)|eukprot:CAMPEP_0184329324 /NCGR_PEP_ID=MMETSP1049-20130417/144090_1 /TAXON_ID=77928 /ORGANISM="Proteomonas sulcata, Strain CCMP704" /LENGTH=219 /DNA_ID=CAMNT_0026651685 /DNA_START=330 /DNA_END=989 /DNA_ORIENTATION=-